MTKAGFLRSLRWRLRLELPGQRVNTLVEPMERFFREGEDAGKSEAQLVAECGDVRLAAAEILSAAAPDRVRHLWLRVAAVGVVWALWYRMCRIEVNDFSLYSMMVDAIGLRATSALLLTGTLLLVTGLLTARAAARICRCCVCRADSL